MKPCSENRKAIVWLALQALPEGQAAPLHAHLETCPGCRLYLEQMSGVTGGLAAVASPPAMGTSERFHQKVVRAVQAEEAAPFWHSLLAHLHAVRLGWRSVLPVCGALVVLAAVAALLWRSSGPIAPPANGRQTAGSGAPSDPDPTLANYQRVANRSLENLDDLLTRQGLRNPSPARTYAAWMAWAGEETK